MKTGKAKKLGVLAAIVILITVVSTVVTKAIHFSEDTSEEQLTIVTSFYPIYIATLNVTKDMENVKVVNLMEQQSGCLHDYQLTTSDMKKFETADVFIMNGAGMEGYIEKVIASYPDLTIIDTSEGIDLLTTNGEVHSHEEDEADHDHDHEDEADHDHDHEDDAVTEDDHDHNHGDYNAHIWMSPANYIQQIKNIATGLEKADGEHAQIYADNAKTYEEKVSTVWNEYKALPAFDYDEVVIFHDSVAYLAKELGIEVAYSVAIDGETSLSAGDIATVIDEVKEHEIKVLFSEVQFEDTIANRISEETGAKVYIIDSMVTGEVSLDAYIDGLQKNLEVLRNALYK